MANKKRLIDANVLLQKIANATGYVDAYTIIGCIYNAPTVDAVEVVRCKDCKHYKSYGKSLRGFEAWGKCLQIDMDVDMPTDGYCCFGERKGNV